MKNLSKNILIILVSFYCIIIPYIIDCLGISLYFSVIVYFLSITLFILFLFKPEIKVFLDINNLKCPTNIIYIIIYICILFLGAYLRIYKIEDIPLGLWFDEAFSAKNAIKLAELGNSAHLFGFTDLLKENWVVTSNLYLFFVYLILKAYNFSIFGLKMISVIPAIGTVSASFFLFKSLSKSNYVSFIGMFLVATSQWSLSIDRWGWDEVLFTFLFVISLIFITSGLDKRKNYYFALAGSVLGLSFYTYLASRMALIIVLAYFISIYFSNKAAVTDVKKGLIYFLLFFTIVCGPSIPYYLTNANSLTVRIQELSPIRTEVIEKGITPLWESTYKHLLMFNIAGDKENRHNYNSQPELDRITGIFFLIGVILTIIQVKKRHNLLLIFWFSGGLLCGILSTLSEGAPHAYRTAMIIPLVNYFAALGLVHSIEFLSESFFKNKIPLNKFYKYFLTFILLILSFWLNYKRYFIEYPNRYNKYIVEDIKLGSLAGKTMVSYIKDQKYNICMDSRLSNTNCIVDYYMYQVLKSKNNRTLFDNTEDFKGFTCLKKKCSHPQNYLLFIIADYKFKQLSPENRSLSILTIEDNINKPALRILKIPCSKITSFSDNLIFVNKNIIYK